MSLIAALSQDPVPDYLLPLAIAVSWGVDEAISHENYSPVTYLLSVSVGCAPLGQDRFL